MFALGLTLFSTGRSNGGINRFGMTESIYVILRNQNLIANRAVLALCLTLFGAGGSNGGINRFGMTESIYVILRNQNLIANRAMLALGFARSGTGGRDGGIDHFGVTISTRIGGFGNLFFCCLRRGFLRCFVFFITRHKHYQATHQQGEH